MTGCSLHSLDSGAALGLLYAGPQPLRPLSSYLPIYFRHFLFSFSFPSYLPPLPFSSRPLLLQKLERGCRKRCELVSWVCIGLVEIKFNALL